MCIGAAAFAVLPATYCLCALTPGSKPNCAGVAVGLPGQEGCIINVAPTPQVIVDKYHAHVLLALFVGMGCVCITLSCDIA